MAVELGTGYVSVVPSARGFGGALSREIDGPTDQAARDAGDRGGRSFVGRFTSGFGAIGTALVGAFAVDFLGDSISAASDLEETLSKVNTIFGESAGGIDAWSQDAATALGQSRQQALDAAGTFGNLFVQLGIGTGVSADMSTSLVELASDFASFHNANPEEVIEAQTAAFRGEYDALQRFVPTINAAAVQQRAMAMTGKDNAEALTDQEKAAATYALMMEGAGDAMGDFDRTSDGLANRQRILSAQFEDVKAKIGAALLPAVTAVAGFFIEQFIPAIGMVSTKIGEVIDWFRQGGDASSGLGERVSGLAEVFTSAFGAIQAYVQTIVAILTELWRRFGDDIIQFARDAWDAIIQVVNGALAILTGIFDLIKAILTGKWGEAWDAIKQILGGAWDAINGILDAAFAVVRGILEVGMGVLSAVWSAAWNGLKTLLSDIWDGIKAVVLTAIGAVVEFVRNLPDAILDAIGDLGSLLYEKGRDLVQGFIDGIRSMAQDLLSTVTGIGGGVLGRGGAADFLPDEGNATGGMRGAFQAGWVGESGKELFIPTVPGMIVPNHKLMGISYVTPGGTSGDQIALLRTQNDLLAVIAANTRGGDSILQLLRVG